MGQLILRLLQLFRQGKVSKEFIKEAAVHGAKVKNAIDKEMLIKLMDDLL